MAVCMCVGVVRPGSSVERVQTQRHVQGRHRPTCLVSVHVRGSQSSVRRERSETVKRRRRRGDDSDVVCGLHVGVCQQTAHT